MVSTMRRTAGLQGLGRAHPHVQGAYLDDTLRPLEYGGSSPHTGNILLLD